MAKTNKEAIIKLCGEINKKEHQFVDFAFEIENISDSTIKIIGVR